MLLRLRNRRYRRIADAEVRDVDAEGIPDVSSDQASTTLPRRWER